jgi:hypothetical protein
MSIACGPAIDTVGMGLRKGPTVASWWGVRDAGASSSHWILHMVVGVRDAGAGSSHCILLFTRTRTGTSVGAALGIAALAVLERLGAGDDF